MITIFKVCREVINREDSTNNLYLPAYRDRKEIEGCRL